MAELNIIVSLAQEGLVARLISWAEIAEDPLRSYATGLLGGAMEIQDVAANFKEQNTRLVSLHSSLLFIVPKVLNFVL